LPPILNGKRAVSHAFANANGIIVTFWAGTFAEVVVRSGAHPSALAEVRRTLGVPLRAREVGSAEFSELLSRLLDSKDDGDVAFEKSTAQGY